MADYYRQIIESLKDAGCSFVRPGKGDHEIWWSPITRGLVTVDRKCDKRHTANGTLKQAGLPKTF